MSKLHVRGPAKEEGGKLFTEIQDDLPPPHKYTHRYAIKQGSFYSCIQVIVMYSNKFVCNILSGLTYFQGVVLFLRHFKGLSYF